MRPPITEELVTHLARLNDVPLGTETAEVASRLAQLLDFARELDGLSDDADEIDAVFDPRWDAGS